MRDSKERFRPLALALFWFGYASYFSAKLVFALAGGPIILALAPWPGFRRKVLQQMTCRYLAFLTRWWLPCLGIYRLVEVSGLAEALRSGPAVWASNHRGFMDSQLLLGMAPGTGALVKVNYTRDPAMGLLVRFFDMVSVNRNSIESVAKAKARCLENLKGGRNLLIFPEGTRARSARLQPFQRIAFDLALDAGVPVVPVVVHSTEPFLSKTPAPTLPRRRNEYRIRFLEAQRPKPGEDAGRFSDRVHRMIARELKELDKDTTWETGWKPPASHENRTAV